MSKTLGKRIMKIIAVFGVLLIGFGFAGAGPDTGLWLFLVGLLLVITCAVSSRDLRKFVRSLLDFIWCRSNRGENMDILFEFFLELIVDGVIETSGNKKLSRWIRYPLIALVVLFFGAVIALIFYLALGLSSDEPVASVILLSLGLLLLVGTVLKFRKLYFEKQSDNGSEATNDKRT